MATNDFLTFATGAGANVMAQADWEALTQRLSGFQSGVAQSAQLNKAWRQSSIMAAVLAQFIVDQSGQDAVDDGTTATLVANLLAAVRAGATSLFSGANQSRGASGYQKFPGGMILQWGTGTTSASGVANITFPIAFPSACYHLSLTDNSSTAGIGGNDFIGGTVPTTTGATVYTANTSGQPSTTGFRYLALGY